MSKPPKLRDRNLFKAGFNRTSARFICGLLLLLAEASVARSGQTQAANTRVPNVEQALKQYGIGLSKGALIAALTNPKGEVRILAALKLAIDKDSDAVPFILKAISVESNGTDRINMALDLALLDDQKGVDLLKSACADQKTAGYLRVLAAQYMLQLGNRECLADVLSVVKNDTEEGSRQAALALLPQYFNGAENNTPRAVLDLVCDRLTDGSAFVRLGAAITLSDIGTSQQVPALRNAIASETDPTVRSQMEDSLRKLKSKTLK